MSTNQDKNSVAWWQPAVAIFARLSAWILLPLLVGVPAGRWLDGKYNTGSRWLLAGAGVAFIISITGLVMTAKKELKKMDKNNLDE